MRLPAIRHPWAVALALLLSGLTCAHADQVQVAVAANFTAPMQKIAAAFEADTGHKAVPFSSGHGQVLCADHQRRTVSGVPVGRRHHPRPARPGRPHRGRIAFTYAIGQLVLWSPNAHYVDAQAQFSRRGDFKHLSLANPKLAPYGAAAMQVLDKQGLTAQLQPRIVTGENIAQAYQFVASGNAQLGFVALSQVMEDGKITKGSAWVVPSDLQNPSCKTPCCWPVARTTPQPLR
jgi:molybdate transport system substrate-binding protein